MKSIQWKFMTLAFIVVLMFIAVGLAIALRNVWLISLFIILGFGVMGYGLYLKRRESD
jgi:hypothetical protein